MLLLFWHTPKVHSASFLGSDPYKNGYMTFFGIHYEWKGSKNVECVFLTLFPSTVQHSEGTFCMFYVRIIYTICLQIYRNTIAKTSYNRVFYLVACVWLLRLAKKQERTCSWVLTLILSSYNKRVFYLFICHGQKSCKSYCIYSKMSTQIQDETLFSN